MARKRNKPKPIPSTFEFEACFTGKRNLIETNHIALQKMASRIVRKAKSME